MRKFDIYTNNLLNIRALAQELNIETKNIFVETDVNCAAYLEYTFGKHK